MEKREKYRCIKDYTMLCPEFRGEPAFIQDRIYYLNKNKIGKSELFEVHDLGPEPEFDEYFELIADGVEPIPKEKGCPFDEEAFNPNAGLKEVNPLGETSKSKSAYSEHIGLNELNDLGLLKPSANDGRNKEPYLDLFNHMSKEHDLILLNSEMQEIISIVHREHPVELPTAQSKAEQPYREVLKKYMSHILHEESVTYLSRLNDNMIKFTSEEVAILREIEGEIE